VSWAFRVGLNQMAGSLGGAASPGYLLKSGRQINLLRTIPHLSFPDW
jgi:hypothetical protein